MIWNEAAETMPRDELEALQLRRLRATVERAYERVPFYRQAFDREGVRPEDVRGLADLRRLPFTRKVDLRENYPFGLLAVPLSEVVRLHASSGTRGKPTVVGYSRGDIETWAEVCARAIGCAGGRPGEIFHNAYGYGLFTGGLGMHYGAERMGMTVVPVSGGNTPRQALLIADFRPTVIACTPSYMLNIADALEERGTDLGSLSLRAAILGAEPWSESMRVQIERRLNLKAVDIYGLSEVIGPGVACECHEAQSGLHICEDHFLPEVVHPETGEPLPFGEDGELVFTSLTKEAFPVIRYRTGDVASLHPEPCRCGRTHVRMGRVKGRTDDMLIIRGVNFFPSELERELLTFPELAPHYQLILTRPHALDEVEVQVELSEPVFAGWGGRLDGPEAAELRGRIGHHLKNALGVGVSVTPMSPRSVPRSEGKSVRVVDRRSLSAAHGRPA